MSSNRRKWTKKVVEAMWAEMAANQHLRKKGRMPAWWAMIAKNLNEKFNHGFTGKACADKASEVHKANRPYPWDPDAQVEAHTPAAATKDTEVRDALFTLAERMERLETTLTDALQERLSPTPDIKPAVNQVWISRARRGETNNEYCHMRISAIEKGEVTLHEISGPFAYTLPLRNLARHFSHVGFASPRPFATIQAPPVVQRKTDPVDTLVAPVTPSEPTPPAPSPDNGHKDLSSLIG